MNVLGVYGGIGSMLVAARNAGCNVVGNIEPRDFEDGQTFIHNFPGSMFSKGELLPCDVDLIVGHPSCGSYSRINWRADKIKRDEVENFVNVVNFYNPKFFIMDNLPKMFIDYNADFWYKELGAKYDISVVFVNNRLYGNAQVRRRVYLIGSLKKFKYVPLPGENRKFKKTTADVIGHLLGKEGQIENHNDIDYSDFWSSMTNVLEPKTKSTYAEMGQHVLGYPEGRSFKYFKEDGEEGTRIGLTKVRWDDHCSTLSSTARQIHPVRLTPLTIKEQLLLMGYPEDFVIKGMKVNEDSTWKIRGQEYQQVNKGVCIQSIQYFIEQVKHYDEYPGEYHPDVTTCVETSSEPHVNSFKYAYCQKPGVYITRDKCSICKMRNVCRVKEI